MSVLPELQIELAARPVDHLMFITSGVQPDKPLSLKYFQQWFARQAETAIGNLLCSAHGLRKACATRLANAGARAFMFKAVTGHKSLKEVERYTEAVNQIRLAQSAQALLARNTLEEHPVSNLGDGLDAFDPSTMKTKEI
ncbi:MAG: tyrosine-type recombinase/integrase [Oceanicaulis sp.]